jgi:hypothetical protein
MSKKILEKHLSERLQSIRLCFGKGYYSSSLILTYCTIDMLAWLAMPCERTRSTKTDFVSWVKKYLLPGSGLSVTAIDLYAARCALVHTYTSRSSLIEKGDASELLYSFGPAERAAELEKAIDTAKGPAKAVHLENLFAALEQAIFSFLEEIQHEPQRRKVVEQRVAWFYSSIQKASL